MNMQKIYKLLKVVEMNSVIKSISLNQILFKKEFSDK